MASRPTGENKHGLPAEPRLPTPTPYLRRCGECSCPPRMSTHWSLGCTAPQCSGTGERPHHSPRRHTASLQQTKWPGVGMLRTLAWNWRVAETPPVTRWHTLTFIRVQGSFPRKTNRLTPQPEQASFMTLPPTSS